MITKNQIKYIRGLSLKKNRMKEQCFIVEGAKSLYELLDSSFEVVELFALKDWINENRDLLKPPVCNKVIWKDSDFIIMVAGGPNSRKDYHIDIEEEFFYQIEGDMLLKTIENGKPKDIHIKEGEIFVIAGVAGINPFTSHQQLAIVVVTKLHLLLIGGIERRGLSG